MSLLVSILAFYFAQACQCGCGGGFNCQCPDAYGSRSSFNTGYGCLCGSDLSDEELEELCACGGMGNCGGWGGMGGCGGCGMGAGMGGCGMNGGFAPAQQCAVPTYVVRPMACQGPTGYTQGSMMNGGRICGHDNSNCANVHGAGSNNCGYNQGNVCGSANRANMNADACRRHGDRHFAKKCADEFMIRRSNEGCATGNDCYDSARANMCANNAQVAGQRGCGNAHSCHNNAAGMRCADRGIAGSANCLRQGAGCISSPSAGCGSGMGMGGACMAPCAPSCGCC